MNAVTCLTCGTRLVSRHVHDYQRCPCPVETMVAIDGGDAYQRILFGPEASWHNHNGGTLHGPLAREGAATA